MHGTCEPIISSSLIISINFPSSVTLTSVWGEARPRNADEAWSSSAVQNSYMDHAGSQWLLSRSVLDAKILCIKEYHVVTTVLSSESCSTSVRSKRSDAWCIQDTVTISCSPSNSILGSGVIEYTNRYVQTLQNPLDHTRVGISRNHE